MAQFQADTRVVVRPFAHNLEGDSVTLGDLERERFVTIPSEGLQILGDLAAGMCVREAERRYELRHGETADIVDFLTALESNGFVAPAPTETATTNDPHRLDAPPQPHFRWISPAAAARVVSGPVLAACAVVTAVGLALVVADPSLIPSSTVFVFHRHLAVLSWALFAFTLFGVFVHEVGHLLAARAAGVPARIRISHRLWILVAETDMTAIWLAPRRRRYVAFLAGPIIDAVCAAALLVVLWAVRSGYLHLSATLHQFIAAALLTYLLRLLWQCFLFVRTDFYYVLATALDCKSLLADTEDLLRNCLARLRRRRPGVDQSGLPPHERRAVRAYAVVWLGGRGLAFFSLIFVALPVLAGYGAQLVRTAAGGHPSYDALDLLTLALLAFGLQGAGLIAWMNGLIRARNKGAAR